MTSYERQFVEMAEREGVIKPRVVRNGFTKHAAIVGTVLGPQGEIEVAFILPRARRSGSEHRNALNTKTAIRRAVTKIRAGEKKWR